MCEVTGTRAAFAALLNQRGIYKKLGIARSTASGYREMLKTCEGLTLDKMEEMLQKAGATIVQEKIWRIK